MIVELFVKGSVRVQLVGLKIGGSYCGNGGEYISGLNFDVKVVAYILNVFAGVGKL